MPTEHRFTTFKYSELSDEAKEKAVEALREKFAGDWWDSSDNETIGEVLLYVLAEQFKPPGWDTFGSADFPGIEGMKIEAWDLERQTLELSGVLTRKTAPALPWAKGNVYQYVFGLHGGPSYVEWDYENDPDVTDAKMDATLQRFHDKVYDAKSEALKAGQTAYDYMTGEEYARERCEEDEWEFYEDGSFYG